MIAVIDRNTLTLTVHYDIDAVQRYISKLELEVDTTLASDWELNSKPYNIYMDDDWIETINESYNIEIVNFNVDEEINLPRKSRQHNSKS